MPLVIQGSAPSDLHSNPAVPESLGLKRCDTLAALKPKNAKEHHMNVAVNFNMVTTAFEISGYKIVKSLGLVRGITVRSRSIFGTIGASLETLVGGNITLFEEMCEKTREEALELMMQHATQHGANAVIGVRYDANELMQGVTEVLAYGTAVQVVPATA
jgi:uncharacterized protein YbjQ (UPF0145 family)